MSKKTRFAAATIALTLLTGTVTFAAPEPQRARILDIQENQSFLGELFGRVRALLEGRRTSKERERAPEPSSTQKDGSCADPNGSPSCRK